MLEALLFFAIAILLPLAGASPFVTILAFGLWACISMPGAWKLVQGDPPLVPTPNVSVNAMMRLAKVKKGDIVYDLGCGDGRIVFAAAKRGAHAIGYEASLPTFLIAWVRSFFHPGAHIRYGNFWKKDLSDADVICCYLMMKPMERFKQKIWPKLKPGTRVASHIFKLPGKKEKAHDARVFLYVK